MKNNKLVKLTAIVLLTSLIFSLPVYSSDSEAESIIYYNGTGSSVAIISHGFNINLDSWSLTNENTAKLAKSDITSLKDELNADTESVYYSAKIPFVYDYYNDSALGSQKTDKGTACASLIGANPLNSKTDFSGKAPEAQLLFMNIANETGSNMSNSAIACALEDAIALNVDAILMGIMYPAGFSDGSGIAPEIVELIKLAEESGILVVAPAGDYGLIGFGSKYDHKLEIKNPISSVIDNGTVSEPSTLPTVISVGGLNNYYFTSAYITLNNKLKTKMMYSDTTEQYITPLGTSFAQRFDGKTIEYTVIPGLGKSEDFESIENLNLKDKFAVISRGEITFVEKINRAAEYGAIGVIIYDNTEDADLAINMDITDAKIPALIVSTSNGKAIIDSENKSITIDDSLVSEFQYTNAGYPASFTSYGVTPELKLKPDISAVAGNISALGDNNTKYSYSGTIYAAASVCGIAIIAKQYLTANKLDNSPAFIRAILGNSANPKSNINSKNEYTPRVQGSGEADLNSLLKTQILLSNSDGEPRVELGDDLSKTFSFNVTLSNITDEDLKLDISASHIIYGASTYDLRKYTKDDVMITKDSENFINNTPESLTSRITLDNYSNNINTHNANYSAQEISLEAGETREIKISVTMNKTELEKYKSLYPYGFYIEGYVYAKTETSKSSIPYMGFYGDWNSIPMFDGTIYDGEDSFYGVNLLYSYLTGDSEEEKENVKLGINFYKYSSMIPQYKLIAFSPNGDGDADVINATINMLRNSITSTYDIYDSDGNAVYSYGENGVMFKTYLDKDYLKEYNFKVWNGRAQDYSNYTYPEGEYYFVLSAVPYNGADTQYLIIPFYLDTSKPELENSKISIEKTKNDQGRSIDKKTLNIKVKDNHYMQSLTLYSSKYIQNLYEENVVIPLDKINSDGEFEYSFDITGVTEQYLYINVLDYAYNMLTERIDLYELLSELQTVSP